MANISNSTANTLVTGTSSADSIYNSGQKLLSMRVRVTIRLVTKLTMLPSKPVPVMMMSTTGDILW